MGNKAIATRHSKQLARHSWDVVNPGLDKPEKEAVVPKVAKTSKEDGAGCSCRPAGPQIHADKANGVFHPTEVAYRVFPPPTYQGFSSCKFTSFPCVRSSLRGPVGSVSDVKQ